ncbi:PREDICTED: E3 ubiquitin-protein ligase RHF2A isoform X2 [Lupinus angustifolius]|uniref:E3 ubiquitin-protein ligase RHF2A isoform X2 n=1 Tax=Lupinus angustifolius TaxID=3871 RepID=UPI00092E914D|nr:PREDICTED: E3 ubiquitin-protein ligase RHF2A isoform X2 [Lupinus angustifolius]
MDFSIFMEDPGMVEKKEIEAHLTSAAAFVEGGVQDSCDDACSICLEGFSITDPFSVTNCKHAFHLQCILEWCQRSSQCPMCWQAISLKDPTSQELLEAVERERNFRFNPSRNTRIFHHPTVGDFELQHLSDGVAITNLEERIIQHLAASAAAMERERHIVRREGQSRRPSAQGQPHFLACSSHHMAPVSSPTQRRDAEPISASGSGYAANHQGSSYSNRRSPSLSSPSTQDRASPSELQLFPESLKSRLNAVSMRYKESISKSTRGWKDRWFSGTTSMSDLGSEVKKEVNAGIATISRMIERLETRDTNRTSDNFAPNNIEDGLVPGSNNQHLTNTEGDNLSRDNTKACCAAGSSSN